MAPEREYTGAHMPDKPDTWARFYLALSDPLWQGVIMAAVISFLRVLYDARETKPWRIILDPGELPVHQLLDPIVRTPA